MYTIELDISHEASLEQITAWASKFNCTPKLIQEIGPAGGNPVYQFSSNYKSNIVSLKKDFEQ